MDAQIERLTQKQGEAAARMREILDNPAGEDGGLSAEQRDNLTAFNADFDRYQADARELEQYRAKLAMTDHVHEQIDRATVSRSDDADFNLSEDSEKRAFAQYAQSFRTGGSPNVSFVSKRTIGYNEHDSMYQTRALAAGIGTVIPTNFADFVAVYERTLNPMLQVSTIISTSNGQPLVIPRWTADIAGGGSVTAEAGGITEVDPTYSAVTLNAYKRANTTLYSAELNQDNVIGLENLLAKLGARALNLAWGTAFTTGNDSTEANGFINAGTNGGTASGTALNTAADTFFAWTDLATLYYGLAAPYRANASWMMATTALRKTRQMRDSTNQPIWNAPLAAGMPESIWGRPVYENPAMAAVASATKSVACGDFSEYYIRDVVPLRVDISDQYKFSTDQLALRIITRRDGDLPDVTAVRYLVSADT